MTEKKKPPRKKSHPLEHCGVLSKDDRHQGEIMQIHDGHALIELFSWGFGEPSGEVIWQPLQTLHDVWSVFCTQEGFDVATQRAMDRAHIEAKRMNP
jgi:hypothetical protein